MADDAPPSVPEATAPPVDAPAPETSGVTAASPTATEVTATTSYPMPSAPMAAPEIPEDDPDDTETIQIDRVPAGQPIVLRKGEFEVITVAVETAADLAEEMDELLESVTSQPPGFAKVNKALADLAEKCGSVLAELEEALGRIHPVWESAILEASASPPPAVPTGLALSGQPGI